jgi:predicted enzyme related to lactoylglutathione lyase
MKYVHTNLVAHDWRSLADFYIHVFNCQPIPPERDLKGKWLDKALSLTNVNITYARAHVHLRLPGYADGPTLEIFQYNHETNEMPSYPNTPGYGHIAFSVPDVQKTANKIIGLGGDWVGELTKTEIKGVGILVFAYMRDPEGNIIEIQTQI